MSDDEIQSILEQLRTGTPNYVVRIDLEMQQPGDRMAHVYVDGKRVSTGLVSRDHVTRLMAAGASWTGTPVRESSPHLRP